ncbi:MAG: CPBP family intramembrane glutamic endopeptidase [Bryobacteraceae bacterium]|jgi:membrane protease YdiL (CAAX protease family)
MIADPPPPRMGEHLPPPRARYGFLLRIGVFVLITLIALIAASTIIRVTTGDKGLVNAALANFAAAAIGTTVALRIYERARLEDIGLGWNRASQRNLALGLLGGIGGGMLVTLPAVPLRLASFAPAPPGGNWRSVIFVAVVLLFGAIGEEIMFRGYAFQVLLTETGIFATVLPVSVLFSLMHGLNPGINPLGFFNTFLWGVLLGFSFLRSGDLWLPIGLHYGWNLALPLLGVNLSGIFQAGIGVPYTLKWNAGWLWSGGEYGPEGGVLTTVVVLILAGYLWKAPICTQRPFLIRTHTAEPFL